MTIFSKGNLPSALSLSCLVKQPNHSERKGVIKDDLGDHFIVNIPSDDLTITVYKLFVYPDFSQTVRQIDKSPRKLISPSTNIPKKRFYLLPYYY